MSKVIGLFPPAPLVRRVSDGIADEDLRLTLGWIDDLTLIAKLQLARGAPAPVVLDRLVEGLEACLQPVDEPYEVPWRVDWEVVSGASPAAQ
jgi:hypothetical protein